MSNNRSNTVQSSISRPLFKCSQAVDLFLHSNNRYVIFDKSLMLLMKIIATIA
jgi:hypothetical protein